ncbi:hypothetical protein HS088_TW03G00326 [Tripterygium wilfordii]|uniref:Uncharacterized protein n=1 Tax=Tripterygium wilfordii TaxID=458696 RepID=A0A7J7DUK6_TRIWF|nr:hypothetical protein HS088_TW03G00326 [Tripterygium wilfordii]
MAAKKLATMLHRNTHKLVVVLTYAILEWILILLLFVNSIFTYLIVQFASYFSLKPPCLWCSRVDHVLEPGNSAHSYRELDTVQVIEDWRNPNICAWTAWLLYQFTTMKPMGCGKHLFHFTGDLKTTLKMLNRFAVVPAAMEA